MKRKKVVVAVFCTAIIGIMSTISAIAATSGTVSSDSLNVSINGYVDFLAGPLLYEDRVYYNASLSGNDISLVDNNTDTKCYVTPRTDKKTIGTYYLNSSNRMVYNNDGAKAGYGGTYAELYMYAAKTDGTIKCEG